MNTLAPNAINAKTSKTYISTTDFKKANKEPEINTLTSNTKNMIHHRHTYPQLISSKKIHK